MKVDIVQRKARKKDFWDLDELIEKYSIEQMIALHKQRYPHGHDEKVIRENFVDFERADEDFTNDRMVSAMILVIRTTAISMATRSSCLVQV